MVDDGQVIVLGGLIQENLRESIQKVPLLGDIPLLGALFRSKTGDVDRTNLMVFIHPVILRDAAVTNLYTNSKYNYIRTLQQGQNADGINLMPGKKHPMLPGMEEFIAIPGATPAVPAAEPAATEPEPEPAGAAFTTDDFAF